MRTLLRGHPFTSLTRWPDALRFPHIRSLRFLLAALVWVGIAYGQKPEYDFYPEFRNDIAPKLRSENPGVTASRLLELYAARLKSEGVDDSEIARRSELISTRRELLESDYWNRFYTSTNSNFNLEPNGFLISVVEGLEPGVALDYGMGQGRNSLYLAKKRWQVWGFDPADAAVAMAQRQAGELGLTLHTAAVRDSDYEFGNERFDLILFSWTMPLVPVGKVVAALKPGGIVVMECGVDFVGQNGMLKMFDPLRIEHYEIVHAKSDFYGRRETDMLRMIARKPWPKG